MDLVRIYTSDDGESHFEDLRIPLSEDRYGPFTDLLPATGAIFWAGPPKLSIDYHRAPRRQFGIILAGIVEIEVSDGEVRRFNPGDLFLADDTTGRGHISRDIEGPRRTAFIRVPQDLDVSAWRI